MNRISFYFLLLAILAFSTPARGEEAAAPAGGERETSSLSALEKEAEDYWEKNFIDPTDGEFDISEFLATRSGFLPAPIILTEPTLGYGGGASLLFLQPRNKDGQKGFRRPNITIVGGLGTQNGTWAGFAGDLRHWLDGRVRTFVGGMTGQIRLDFYGLGLDRITRGNPVGYQLDVNGARVGGQYRLTGTDIWLGASYQYASIDATFRSGVWRDPLPQRNLLDTKATLSGPIVRATWDTRNSIFTPTRGYFSQVELGTGWEALGGSTTYQVLDLTNIAYFQLAPTVSVGVRADFARSFGDPPFYLEPSLAFEGLPAMRYQGRMIAQGQGQVSWRFWNRFSLVGFVGGGGAWNRDARFHEAKSAWAGGGGVRYELARLFKLSYGFDYAWGPDGGIFYVVVGSAWKFPGSSM